MIEKNRKKICRSLRCPYLVPNKTLPEVINKQIRGSGMVLLFNKVLCVKVPVLKVWLRLKRPCIQDADLGKFDAPGIRSYYFPI